MTKKRIIVAITGASGAIYGMTLLKTLSKIKEIETHLIISNTAADLLRDEIGAMAPDNAASFADYTHDVKNLAAPISSGSFKTDGMVVAPCSAKTLSSIANAYGNNLITRAADVVLKERRKLVLLFRETPFNLAHIENMAMITKMGGIIMPPLPAFYSKPSSIDDLVNQSIGRALSLLSIKNDLYEEWDGD